MGAHSILNEFKDKIGKGCILEIGSVRESISNSSTQYFNELSKELNKSFYSVDIGENQYNKAKSIIGNRAYKMKGEEFLNDFNEDIAILYLDNFDIIYNDSHKHSLLQRVGNDYSDLNLELDIKNSQQAHLNQFKLSEPLLNQDSIVIVDDTWYSKEWKGKGGTLIPYMLEKGWEILKQNSNHLILWQK
jgi:predicted O-methyltransferase YrrM